MISGKLDNNKVQAILLTHPQMDTSHLAEIESKVALSWVRHNRPEVKSAMSLLKNYVQQQ